MRNTLLVATLLGGAVSLLGVLATHSHRSGAAKPTADLPRAPEVLSTAIAIAEDSPPAPAWVAERTIDGPPVSLTASDGSGLTIASLRANAVVEGPLAFTEMKLVFDNPENRVREGTFKIVLPQGASVARFAMKIDRAWQEGEVVPKARARVAYEDALHRKQDPALLERGAANEFSARVFPIPAHGRKEIIVSYAQEILGGAPYSLPLRGLPQVGALDISVGGEGVTAEHRHEALFTPIADFVLESGKRQTPTALRAGNLVVARVRPVAEALPDPVARAVILVDTSASRALGLTAELRAVQAFLRGLSERRGTALPVTVAAFDQEVAPIYDGDAKDFGQAEMDVVAKRRALGASNLEKALAWAKDEAKRTGADRVVLVTDAVPTAGEEDAAKLARSASALKDGGVERLDVVAVGGLRDDALARKLVTAGLGRDGVVVAANDGSAAIVRRLEAGTRSDVAVAVEGASWSYPTRLDGVQPGDEVVVYAEMSAEAANEPLRVTVGGAEARSLDAIPAERPLVERAWAQAKIASLEEEERDQGKSPALEKKIVALSTTHRVLSAYTALLVLETDADYARFQIDRRARADILTVNDDGQLGWTKRGELAAGGAGADDKESARPSRGVAARAGDEPVEDAPLQGASPSSEATPDALPMLAAKPAPARTAAAGGEVGDSFGAGGLALAGASGAMGTRAKAEEGTMGDPSSARAARIAMPEPMLAVAPAPAPPPAATASAATVEADSAQSPTPVGASGHASGRGVLAAPAPDTFRTGMVSIEGRDERSPFTGKFKTVKDRLAHDRSGAYTLASLWEASEPGDVLALVALGETAEAIGELDTAARAYGSIIDLFPARADLRRFAGERLEHVKGKGALDLAIDTFDKARRDRPDHPASHRLAAFARVRRGEYAAAFEILVAGLAQKYPGGRFLGVDRILREDLGLVAAAWMKAVPSRREEILGRLRAAGGTIEDGPSIRFVLNWETDANDVDFHIHDADAGHAFYASPHLPSGGDLYADVTTGYGPECFTVRRAKGERATPYRLEAHYYSRGPMGYGMGKLEIIDHDGHGGLTFEERPFVVMVDQAFVDLGTVR